MTDDFESVETFITELNKRIDILKNNECLTNLNNTSFNDLLTILSCDEASSINDIKSNIKNIDAKELSKALSIVGLSEANIEKYQSSYDILKKEDGLAFKIIESELAKMFKEYIDDYVSIRNSQEENQLKKIKTYTQIIEVLSKNNNSKMFSDFSTLNSIMTEVGLSKEDKWKVLKYIAINNLAISKNSLDDLNYQKRVYNILYKYLNDPSPLVNKVRKLISIENIDIYAIPSLASKISKRLKVDQGKIKNIIYILVISGLYEELTRLLKEEGPKEKIEEIKEQIDEIIYNVNDVKIIIMNEARLIVSENEEFLNNILNNTESNLLELMELPLSEIEEKGVSKETAIDLKKAIILKTIKETLENKKSVTSKEENKEYLDVLNQLIDAYYEVSNKYGLNN